MASKTFRLTSGGMLGNVLRDVIEEYNRRRGAEAEAKIIRVEGDTVYVLVRGHFCVTCGVNDWLDDIRYMLEERGVKAELVKIVEPPDPEEPWRIGVFRVKRLEAPNESG